MREGEWKGKGRRGREEEGREREKRERTQEGRETGESFPGGIPSPLGAVFLAPITSRRCHLLTTGQ